MSASKWLLNGEPKRAQVSALSFCEKGDRQLNCGFLLEMGLGKTPLLLADFVRLHKAGVVEGLAIVAPFSLLGDWEDYTRQWVKDKHINIAIWPNLPEKDNTPWVWILSYEAVSVGHAKGRDMLRSIFTKYKVLFALDESIQIKNNTAVRTKAILEIRHGAVIKRILTGRAAVKGPQDLWSQLTFLDAPVGNFYQFRNTFCVMGGYENKKVVATKNGDKLQELINQHCIVMKKKDWTNLPEKLYQKRVLKMTPKQEKAYKSMWADFVTFIQGEAVTADMVITQAIKLQQISSGFIIDEDKNVRIIEKKPAKLMEIHEILEQIEGKLIVVVHFRFSVEMLKAQLREYGVCLLVGGMKTDEIREQKRLFNTSYKHRVCIAVASSQKYGHTLLGMDDMRCSTMYFYENSLALDDRIQIEDRIHREGQTEDCVYIDPICSPKEKDVILCLQRKDNVTSALFKSAGLPDKEL